MDVLDDAEDISDKGKKKGGKKKKLTLERMRIALEKLQLARLKATVTFIVLGFGAYKLFYARQEEGKSPLVDFITGREVGIFLILTGFFALLFSTLQHVRSLDKLKEQYPEMTYSVSLYLSYLVLALSMTLFFTVVLRL